MRFIIDEEFFRVWDKNPVATFSFVDNESGLEYRDFKLFKRADGGFFVKSPNARSYEDKQGNQKFIQAVRAAYVDGEYDEVGVQWFDDLAEAAFTVYAAKVKEEKRSSRSAPSKPTPRGRS